MYWFPLVQLDPHDQDCMWNDSLCMCGVNSQHPDIQNNMLTVLIRCDSSVCAIPAYILGEHTYVPRVLCSPGPMFPGSHVPRVLVGGGGGGGGEYIVGNIAIDVGI